VPAETDGRDENAAALANARSVGQGERGSERLT